MRSRFIVSALTVLGALAGALRAETSATIAIHAEARSGPSYNFYATSLLNPGDIVTVLGAAPNDPRWLVIKPPRTSFSWIDALYLSADHKMVQTDRAPVRIGSQVYNGTPTVQGPPAAAGTQIRVIDPKPMNEFAGGHTWLMIAVLPKEVRYIPADCIQQPATSGVAQSATPQSPAISQAFMPQQPQATTTADPLWDEAERAEQAGDTNRAIALYDQYGQRGQNEERRITAGNRSHWLRQGYRGPYGSNTVAGRAAYSTTALQRPTYGYPYNTNCYPSSQYCYAQDTGQRLTAVPVQATAYTPPYRPTVAPVQQAAAVQPVWSAPGRLRASYSRVGGHPVYALETSQGGVILYAVAEPGVNLEHYRESIVRLGGPMAYDGQLRQNYMRVTAVVAAR